VAGNLNFFATAQHSVRQTHPLHFNLHPNYECSFASNMAALSPATQDRLFIFGLGLATSAVIGAMRQLLVHFRDAAALPPPENKSHYITQNEEDSLKLGTLDKLLDSPNYCIQETAAIIICERALHDAVAMDALLWYITQPEHNLREQGIRALTMMMNACEAPRICLRLYYTYVYLMIL
jgi:hypothetical protein